jgi:predicted TIM-barrel fold metal-dependent hydrolase
MLPQLLYRRLDEIGVDFAVLYPTYGFVAGSHPEPELRRVMSRAFNRYSAEVFSDFRDRLEPAAVIPMVTPDEAVAEIDHVVDELGLKAVMLAGVISRRWPDTIDTENARWMDTLAHDSPFDYEPVWALCQQRQLTLTFHSGGQGWGTRMSTTNYMYNHLGSFAAGAEAAARSLIFGGVPRRYPDLRFAFLEGGVS